MLLVPPRAITAFGGAALGMATPAAAGLLSVTAAANRTTAPRSMASVLCAMPTRVIVIPAQHSVIPALKGFRCCPCFDAGISLHEIARSSRAMTGGVAP